MGSTLATDTITQRSTCPGINSHNASSAKASGTRQSTAQGPKDAESALNSTRPKPAMPTLITQSVPFAMVPTLRGMTNAPNDKKRSSVLSILEHLNPQRLPHVKSKLRATTTTDEPSQEPRTNTWGTQRPRHKRLYDNNAARTILVDLYQRVTKPPVMDTIRTNTPRKSPQSCNIRQ